MKRTYLQKNTYTDEQAPCEFHPDENSFNEQPFDPKDIQCVKNIVQMKTIKFNHITVFVGLMLITLATNGQSPKAGPGPDGIFIYFGKNLPLNFQYKLERKVSGSEMKWEEIYRTPPPDLNYQVVLGKLLQSGSKNPSFSHPDSATIAQFIEVLRGKQTTDSVYLFNGHPAYLETMGTGFYDILAKPGTAYEYRVSQIDHKGAALKTTNLKADPYPWKPEFEKPVFLKHTATSKSIVMNFLLNGQNVPTNIRVFKQATLQTPFREIFPFKIFSRGEKGIGLTLIDSLVAQGVSYRYLLVPVDMLGNAGSPSDTIRITFKQEAIAPIEKFETKTEGNSIVLLWRSPMQKHMRSISIFRSDNFDGGFALLNRVPASDSSYTDNQIMKGISYFYYLVFEGLTETSPPTAKVIGLVDELEKPILSPGSVQVETTPLGNRVQWERTETHTKGYYVYRGEGFTIAEEQISNLIVTEQASAFFIDSIKNLLPGQTYCYAVSAVNRGNLEGPRSAVAIAEPIKPELPTPINLVTQIYNDKAMLFWDDISSLSKFITGYRVFRSEDQGKNWDTLSTVGASTFYDSTVVRGITYSYSIQAVGMYDAESPLSTNTGFTLPLLKPVPPSGIRLTKTDNEIVLYWDKPSVAGLSHFNVYREKLGEARKLVSKVSGEITVFTSPLPEIGNWFYTITSVTVQGDESLPSEEVGIKTK